MAARNGEWSVAAKPIGTVLWRLFWGWSALCGAGLGVVLLIGGVSYWSDPRSSTAWKVVPLTAGLMFLAMSLVVVMLLIWRPHVSVESVLKTSRGYPGVTLVAHRRREVALLVFTAAGILNTAVGVVFTEGPLQVVLVVFTGVLLFPLGVIAFTYRRPRFLRLSSEGLESASLRAHTQVTWEDLAQSGVAGSAIGSAELIAQLHVSAHAAGYRELWRNRWQPQFKKLEPLGAVVDIEHRLMGVNQNALLALVTDVVRIPRLRPYLDRAPEKIAQLLINPPNPWPDNGDYLTKF